MANDDPMTSIDKMSLPDLATLQTDVTNRVTAGKITPQQANDIAAAAEQRIRAIKREISSH